MLVFCLIVMRFGTAALLAATATPETPRAMHRPAAPTASLRFFIRVLSWCGRPAPTLRPDVSEWGIYRVSSRTFLVAPIAVAPRPVTRFRWGPAHAPASGLPRASARRVAAGSAEPTRGTRG